MQKFYRLEPHSCYDQFTTETLGDNVSSVVDRLIRLAAKLTEMYASDIVYDINSFKKAVEGHEDFDRVLVFREGGVVSDMLNHGVYAAPYTDGIQTWRLEYCGRTQIAKLERVDVVELTGKYQDERGETVTEVELYKEFDANRKENPREYNMPFVRYRQNCLDKNGTLTKV